MFLNPNRILPPEPIAVSVILAPAYNVLTSMALIDKIERTTDLDDWVVRTVAQLKPAQLDQHHLIFWGFGFESIANAVAVNIVDLEFPAYLAALKTADPVQLRDNIWQSMRHSAHARLLLDVPPEEIPADLLQDRDVYIAFFAKSMKQISKEIPYAVFVQAYELLINPPALQAMLVTHLAYLWEHHVQAEWQRIRPLLQDSVNAIQQIAIHNLPIFDLIQTITRRDLRTIFRREELLKVRQIQFIPSLHNGPYIMWSGKGDTLRISFSAYIPQGSAVGSETVQQLSQAELLNRLKALADENRLKILEALSQTGELSTPEIMAQFGLSKSAVSRHLRQLHANNLITERRVADGVKKLYRLNVEQRDALLAKLAQLLQGPPTNK
ncbi:MAG: metalloregulator ArsR/SmtB family transcription factor [Chloroflexota bacterium]